MPVPPLVERAVALASRLRFDRSCSQEAGRLLHVLAGAGGRTRVAETGTGVGVGTAWIVSALDPAAQVFTAETDGARAAAAAELFAADLNVHVLEGDWHELLDDHAPFDLLFHDAAKQRPDADGEQTVRLLAPRGLVVLDDLTPGREGFDPVREFWLGHSDLAATELQVSAREAVIVAVRVR